MKKPPIETVRLGASEAKERYDAAVVVGTETRLTYGAARFVPDAEEWRLVDPAAIVLDPDSEEVQTFLRIYGTNSGTLPARKVANLIREQVITRQAGWYLCTIGPSSPVARWWDGQRWWSAPGGAWQSNTDVNYSSIERIVQCE